MEYFARIQEGNGFPGKEEEKDSPKRNSTRKAQDTKQSIDMNYQSRISQHIIQVTLSVY